MNYCFVCICEWASYKYFPACSTSWLLMTQQWGLSGFFALCQACPADTQGGGQCLVWWHVSVSRTISCFTQGTQVWRVLPPTTAYFVWQWHGWFLRKGWRLVINRWKKKDFNKAAAVRRAGNQDVSNRANEMSFSHTFTMWGRCFTAHWLNSIGVHTKRKDKLAF